MGRGEVKLVLENCGLAGGELAFNTKASLGRGGIRDKQEKQLMKPGGQRGHGLPKTERTM